MSVGDLFSHGDLTIVQRALEIRDRSRLPFLWMIYNDIFGELYSRPRCSKKTWKQIIFGKESYLVCLYLVC